MIESVDADLAPKITFLEAAYSTYDTVTRDYTGGYCAHEGVICVRAGLTDDDMQDTEIVTTTAKFLIASKNLPDVTPKIQDRIMDADGQHYSVLKVKTVPGKSLWILFGIETQP
ncbi:MAG: hypothetical protein ABJJ53_14235 [Sulfitobacter sp.]